MNELFDRFDGFPFLRNLTFLSTNERTIKKRGDSKLPNLTNISWHNRTRALGLTSTDAAPMQLDLLDCECLTFVRS